MIIRQARLEDSHALATLHDQGFVTPGWSATFWANSLSGQTDLTLVAEEAGQPLLGLCCLRRVLDEAEILTFCVRPAVRRAGTGRALLSAGLEALTAMGCPSVFLEVSEHNRTARRLYSALGFTESGRRRDYYGHEDSAILMRWTA